MAFQDPVLGGNNKLIRTRIQSPDYVAGVSGWTINKDGTAEFNGVTVRGELIVTDPDGSYVRIYDQDPGSGALIEFGLPTASGTILTPATITSSDNASGTGHPGIVIRSASVDGSPVSILNMISNTTDDISQVFLDATKITIQAEDRLGLYGGNDVVVQMHPSGGKQLTVEGATNTTVIEGDLNVEGSFSRPGCVVSFGTPTLTTAIPLTLTLSVIQDTYGMWNAGTPTVVTIPKDGTYEVGSITRFAAQAVAAGIRQVNFRTNGVVAMQNVMGMTATLNNIDVAVVCVWQENYTTGQTIDFRAHQTSGGNLALIAGSRGWVRMVEG